MSRADDYLLAGFKSLPPKPSDDAARTEKQKYSQRMSEKIANALSAELRDRGLAEVRPAAPGELDASGAERRMSGGIGAKKVDVSWATEESGLLCAVSVKTINFRDKRSGHFQKNLTNRRGDMLFEAVTLHRRFPYAVLAGFMFLDHQAASDATERRQSTFLNAHDRLRIFTGRGDPADRDEQYEGLYIGLVNANLFEVPTRFEIYEAGTPDTPVELAVALDRLMVSIAERNPDFYQWKDGELSKI